MPARLEQKVAIVTGGARGIGQGIVELFAEESARVVVADINPAGEALARRLGDRVLFKRTDVTVEADIDGVVAFCVERFGRLDVMVNNAGAVGDQTSLLSLDAEGFSRTCDLLLRGAALGHKYAGRQMKAQGTGGSIVSISSLSGFQAGWSAVSYDVAKAGVIQLARAATFELAPYRIRSNVVAPGLTLTPIIPENFKIEAAQHDLFLDCVAEHYAGIIPLGQGARPRDIAEAVLYFASDAARLVSGQTLAVDGGLTSMTAVKVGEVVQKALEDFNRRTGNPAAGQKGWLSGRD